MITIQCKYPITLKVLSEEIDAEIFGAFAVHPDYKSAYDPSGYTLTHVATGYAFLFDVARDDAVAAAGELNDSPNDWAGLKSAKDLTGAQRAEGIKMRKRYPSLD